MARANGRKLPGSRDQIVDFAFQRISEIKELQGFLKTELEMWEALIRDYKACIYCKGKGKVWRTLDQDDAEEVNCGVCKGFGYTNPPQ